MQEESGGGEGGGGACFSYINTERRKTDKPANTEAYCADAKISDKLVEKQT